MDLDEKDDQQSEFRTGLSPWMKTFFGAAVLCAIFFALGYSFGRNSAPIATTNLTGDPKPVAGASTEKPSAAQAQNAGVTDDPNVAAKQSDLTFYKSVENKPDAQLTPPPAQETKPVQAPPAQTAAQTPKSPPEMANIKVGGNIAVQVAAVSKEEDADALVGALRSKNYPVFVVSNVPGDKLFHVQVGPFAEIKDAEAIRARLASDGYNPIIKK
jgi:cell division septation protein DedD